MPDQIGGHAGPNAAQIEYWNSSTAARWVAEQERMDRQFAPLSEALLARSAPAEGERVVDVGCGCGATVLALAERVGTRGHVLGLDVSGPMVARARERSADLPQVDLALGDAAMHAFRGDADLMVSRLGVMFFADPAAALAHLRTALRPGGRLAFVCWRPLAENPWFTVPVAAAGGLLPPPEPTPPDAPGPFAFADPARVRALLAGAGWREVDVAPLDLRFVMAGRGDVADAAHGALVIGPLGRMMGDATPALRAQVHAAVEAALAQHDGPDGITLPGALWMFTARA